MGDDALTEAQQRRLVRIRELWRQLVALGVQPLPKAKQRECARLMRAIRVETDAYRKEGPS